MEIRFTKKIGWIFLIMISLSIKTMAQTIPSYVPTNGLVGWWPFNGNANDESGNRNHGTVNGATLTSDRFGNTGKAYSFDGVNDFINLNNTIGNFQTNDFTISCWSNDTNSVKGGALISKRNDLGFGNFFSMDWVNAPNLEINQNNSSDHYYYNSSLNLLNNWKNYVLIRKGNSIKIIPNEISKLDKTNGGSLYRIVVDKDTIGVENYNKLKELLPTTNFS